MAQKQLQVVSADRGVSVKDAGTGPNADRHFLFNCHRIAMDFGIQAALRALELNTQAHKKTA